MGLEAAGYDAIWAEKVKRSPWKPGEGGAYGRNERLLDAMARGEIRTGGALLDVGCGRGDLMAEALKLKRYEHAYGIEISGIAWGAAARQHGFAPLQWAREYHMDSGYLASHGAVCVLHDARDTWPFEPGLFDAVSCLDTIEHVYPWDGILREAFRVLKPGGDFWLSTPNLMYEGYLHDLARGVLPRTSGDLDEPLPMGGHVTPGFTYYFLRDWLKRVGFETRRYGLPVSSKGGYREEFLKRRWREAHSGDPAEWEEWDARTCDLIIVGRKP